MLSVGLGLVLGLGLGHLHPMRIAEEKRKERKGKEGKGREERSEKGERKAGKRGRERQAEEERAWRRKCDQLKDQWMAHYNKMVKKGVEPSEVWGPIFQKKGGAQ